MSSTAPQPSLLFSFNGSNVDSVAQLSPSSTTGTPSFVPGNYMSSIQLTNTQGSAPTTFLTYNTIPAISNATGFTISFWLNSPSITSTSNCLGISASDDVFFQLTSSTAGFGGKNVTGTTAPSFTIPVGQWVNYALAVNPTSWNQYINGALQTTSGYTATSTSLTSISGPLTVGTTPTVTNGTTISIQDLRVYNSALSTSQILGIYQSQGIPPRLTLTGANLVQPTYLWPFNGSTTDIITNKAPSSSNISGTVTSTLPISWPFFDFNNPKYGTSSIYANGNIPYVLYYNNLNIPVAGSTITLWLRIQAYIGSVQAVINVYPSGQNGFYISPTTTGLLWTVYIGGGQYISGSTSTGSLNTWGHCAISFTSTTATLYFNGVNFATSTYQSLLANSANTWNNISLGQWQYAGAGGPCNISDLRIYNTALTAAQIYGIYQSGGIPPNLTMVPSTGGSPSPTYAWPFNGSTIDIIRGLDTAKSNIAGAYTAGNPNQKPWPYYDKTGQKAGASSIVLNNFGTISSNAIEYSLTNGLSIDQSNAVSYSFWLKFILSGQNYSPIRFFSSMGQTIGAIQQYNNLLQLIFSGATIPGTTISQINTNFNISAVGIWYHIAVVVTSSGMKLYGNGTLLGTNTYSPPLSIQSTSNTIASFNLSCNGITNPTYATSSNELADLRIYNTALSTSQIQTIYLSGGAPPSAVLTSG
jgi:Concanavalin A-like lectin/glucanases superfamily